MGGLAAALEAAHQHDAGRLGGELNPGVAAAHEGSQLLVDDLDDLLGGGEAFENLLPDRALADRLDEVLDDLVVHVGLKEGHLDLPHGLLDVGFIQFSFRAKLFERRAQFFRKAFECQ